MLKKVVVKMKLTHFIFSNFFRKSRRLWDNVQKYDGAWGTTNDVTERIRVACWISKAIWTHAHAQALITKRITKLYSHVISATFDFESQCLLQDWAFHGINNTVWYDMHTKRTTILYSPSERCNQQLWWNLTSKVTPTPYFFLHAPCLPDQMVSGERTASGR